MLKARRLNCYQSSAVALLLFLTAVVAVVVPVSSSPAADDAPFFREEFIDLADWRPLFFPKIKEHSQYSVEKDGEASVLKMASVASASGLLHKEEFDVYSFPWLHWRWRVDKVYPAGDARTKKGDDYPARIYVSFKFDPETAGFWQKVKYDSIRLLYGQYPPHSSLNYVWANRRHDREIMVNSYTDRAMMIFVEMGEEYVGAWQEQAVNIIDDYRKAFGEDPPARAALAVMNDADDTGDRSVSWLDYIEVVAQPPVRPAGGIE